LDNAKAVVDAPIASNFVGVQSGRASLLAYSMDLYSMFSAMSAGVAMHDDGNLLSTFSPSTYSYKYLREF
jgi:hypothetical protein